ncbi:MAG: diguanylate cyclase, partial [Chloroflexota bacterium]|nr:diguanylate cyclase [Chloroflexota bacterium]
LHVTMSIGVACLPIDAHTPTDLIHKADIAVYQAKLNGRNCVVCGSDIPEAIGFAPAPSDRLTAPHSSNFTPRPVSANGSYRSGANGSQSSGMPSASLATKPAPSNGNSTAAPLVAGRPPLRPNTEPILAAGTAPLISPVTVAMSPGRPVPSAVITQPITRPITEPKLKAEKYELQVNSSPQPHSGLQKAVFPMFIASVILAGLAFAFTGFFMHTSPDPVAVALFVGLAVGAELLQLDLYGKGTVSVSVAIAFAAALVTGLPGLVLV